MHDVNIPVSAHQIPSSSTRGGGRRPDSWARVQLCVSTLPPRVNTNVFHLEAIHILDLPLPPGLPFIDGQDRQAACIGIVVVAELVQRRHTVLPLEVMVTVVDLPGYAQSLPS